MQKPKSGNVIRQEFIEFFLSKGHKFVPSSSLVPGGDQTLLFTNAGMVQFKDVFLGIDNRNYTRAVNSQKCMRVAGKHNDLDDVGRDDYHHTFFEMLGNWSFGDYYKKEAISWAWELLTDVWGLEKNRIWVTCFKDEKQEIETDQEAADEWKLRLGIVPDHILFFGRKDNFWEMADIGPCGPCSEIHYDRGIEYCDRKDDKKHQCGVNGNCHRFLELWNLVFIQYNRSSPDKLEPLPAKHVDTGMGFERITSVLQGVDSNYRTDLLQPLMDEVMILCGDSNDQREKNLTPYRVIADHARAATFLIADGVIPGNVGRNYVCRMIIRRAARFGSKLGLNQPFLGQISRKVIEMYKNAYPELEKNQASIIDNISREEVRFQNTVETGMAYLDEKIRDLEKSGKQKMSGEIAFDLYATHGLPLEITKDILREKGLGVNEEEFHSAMQTHRLSSGAGKEMGSLGGEDAEFFTNLSNDLIKKKKMDAEGVFYDPYNDPISESEIIAIIKDGSLQEAISEIDSGEILIKKTGFYIESGGQVSDTGIITTRDGKNEFFVEDVRKPAPGIVIHIGRMIRGQLKDGEKVIARVDIERRKDIMRNHTATHLLHSQLRKVLGQHVRQAGSLVAPDRLRFDFTHPDPLSEDEIEKIEKGINKHILNNFKLLIEKKPLQKALDDGAIALFGEKYTDEVRTISIGDQEKLSFELCGGTHVHETAEIGYFSIMSESSTAAGIRRIEAVTGHHAFRNIAKQARIIKEASRIMDVRPNEIIQSIERLVLRNQDLVKRIKELDFAQAIEAYEYAKNDVKIINSKPVLTLLLEKQDLETLRKLADRFRNEFGSGIAVFANVNETNQIEIIATVTEDLVKEGYHAGRIVKSIAEKTGGGGGGKPQIAQAGGKDKKKLIEVFEEISNYLIK